MHCLLDVLAVCQQCAANNHPVRKTVSGSLPDLLLVDLTPFLVQSREKVPRKISEYGKNHQRQKVSATTSLARADRFAAAWAIGGYVALWKREAGRAGPERTVPHRIRPVSWARKHAMPDVAQHIVQRGNNHSHGRSQHPPLRRNPANPSIAARPFKRLQVNLTIAAFSRYFKYL